MLTSIATVSLSGTLEEKIDAIAAAEFDGLEIFENDLLACPLSPGEIRRRCEDRLVYIDLFQPFRDFEGVTGTRFEANLRRAEAKLALARELGAPMMLACASVQPDTARDDKLIVDQLRMLGDLAARYSVRVAYEALAWSTHVSTYDHAWDLVAAADHPSVGLCLDSFHILAKGTDVEAMASIPGERVFFCQLADAPAMSLDPLSWSRHHRVFPGQGSLDLTGFLTALLRTGYHGPLSLEIFNDVFRQADPSRTAVDGMRSLRYLQDTVRKSVAAGAADGEGLGRQLVHLTGAQPALAVDFVELHAGDDPGLTQVLAGLGFAAQGTHVSKPVDLWRQGAARLVVNRAAPAPQAPRLGGLGFRVGDADAWARRAQQLLAPGRDRVTGRGEEVLRLVTAPDGIEVLVSEGETAEPAWLKEFPPPPPAAHDAGIVSVDHVSLTQPWQSFDESVLFARAMLGLDPSSSVDVADPSGLVRSQVLSSPDGRVRLVLNVLPTALVEQPTPGRGHAEHVAFRSEDIFHTGRVLRDNGVPTLDIPPNYYDDLVARFDLSTAWAARLQELNLLYDRDEHGAYVQLYTRNVGDLFFEVVERTGAYAGFGASNAPVRRAAQRRCLHDPVTG